MQQDAKAAASVQWYVRDARVCSRPSNPQPFTCGANLSAGSAESADLEQDSPRAQRSLRWISPPDYRHTARPREASQRATAGWRARRGRRGWGRPAWGAAGGAVGEPTVGEIVGAHAQVADGIDHLASRPEQADDVAAVVEGDAGAGAEKRSETSGRARDARNGVGAGPGVLTIVEYPAAQENRVGPEVVELDDLIARRHLARALPIIVRPDQDFVDHHPAGDPGGLGCGEENRVGLQGRAGDRMALGIMAAAKVAGEGPPIARAVVPAAALHAGPRSARSCGPAPSIGVGAVDQRAGGIAKPEAVPAVVEASAVDLVGGKIRDRRIVRPFEEEVTTGGERPVQGY